MKSKTTKEILESNEAKEYFDIQQDLDSSEIPEEENIDYDRLKSWCATHNDIWVKLEDLREVIIQMSYQKKSLINLYDRLFYIPTKSGEEINKIEVCPNADRNNSGNN